MSLYLFSFIVGASGAWVLMKYGAKAGLVDIPNHRSSHTKIIPKGGGVGILLVLVLSCLILSLPPGFWFPAIVMASIGFWGGDKHCLSPKERLIVQFVCSLVFLGAFMYPKATNFTTVLLCGPLSIFIVGTSNFYNFMDGIDGIAGITGVVGFSLLAFFSYVTDINGAYGILCISLAFSCLGFLCFNMPKAKVFLGDVGSIMLGFVFACLMIVLSENAADLIVMVGFLSTFYFDELFTMVIRIRNGDSLIQPHRKHIYQILVNELSVRHWRVALSYGFIQLIIGLSAIYIRASGLIYLLLLYLFYCIIFTFVSIRIRKKANAK